MDERRTNSRVDMQTNVKVYVESIGDFIETYSNNLSAGGMMIRLEQAVEKGATITVEFRLKSEHFLIKTDAAVQWVRQTEQGHTAGIKFLGLDEQARNFIEEAVKLHRKGRDPAMGTDDFLAPPEGGTDMDFGVEEIEEVEEIAVDEIEELDSNGIDLIEEIDELKTVDLAPGTTADAPLNADSLEELDLGELAEPEAAPPPAADDLFVMTEDLETVEADVIETPDEVDQQSFGFSPDEDGMEDSLSLSEEIDLTHGAPKANKNGRTLLVVAGVVVAAAVVAGGAMFMLGGTHHAEVNTVEEVPEPPKFAEAASEVTEAKTDENTLGQEEPGHPGLEKGKNLPAVVKEKPSTLTPHPKPVAVPSVQPKPASGIKTAKKVSRKQHGTVLAGLVVRQDRGTTYVEIQLDGTAGKVRSFAMRNPPRYIVDLLGVLRYSGKNVRTYSNPLLNRIRIGRHKDKIRLVLDLSSGKYRAKRQDSGDKVTIELHR